MITIAQIRAARALLGWSQSELAAQANVSLPALNRLERGESDPRLGTVTKIQATLEQAGVILIPANGEGVGVRLRRRDDQSS